MRFIAAPILENISEHSFTKVNSKDEVYYTLWKIYENGSARDIMIWLDIWCLAVVNKQENFWHFIILCLKVLIFCHFGWKVDKQGRRLFILSNMSNNAPPRESQPNWFVIILLSLLFLFVVNTLTRSFHVIILTGYNQ